MRTPSRRLESSTSEMHSRHRLHYTTYRTLAGTGPHRRDDVPHVLLNSSSLLSQLLLRRPCLQSIRSLCWNNHDHQLFTGTNLVVQIFRERCGKLPLVSNALQVISFLPAFVLMQRRWCACLPSIPSLGEIIRYVDTAESELKGRYKLINIQAHASLNRSIEFSRGCS